MTDQVGSVRFVVNVANGSVTQALNYDEFGNVTSDSNPGFQPFGFAGGIYNQESPPVWIWGKELMILRLGGG